MMIVTNKFGTEQKILTSKKNNHALYTDVGEWDFRFCLSCFINNKLKTNNKCLGSCVNDDPHYTHKVMK